MVNEVSHPTLEFILQQQLPLLREHSPLGLFPFIPMIYLILFQQLFYIESVSKLIFA